MNNWSPLLHFVRDNLSVLLFLVVVTVLGGAWVVFEALRSQKNRDEVSRLRRRVQELEAMQAEVRQPFADPLVLQARWIRTGSAATTTDGGCLLFVDKVSVPSSSAALTVRVDGYPVLQQHDVQVGQRLEAAGKYGTYILELCAVQPTQANVAVALRSRHKRAGDEA